MYIHDGYFGEFVIDDKECSPDEFKSHIKDAVFVQMGIYGIDESFHKHPVPLKRYVDVKNGYVLYRRAKCMK